MAGSSVVHLSIYHRYTTEIPTAQREEQIYSEVTRMGFRLISATSTKKSLRGAQGLELAPEGPSMPSRLRRLGS